MEPRPQTKHLVMTSTELERKPILPTSTDALIFPEVATNWSQILSRIKQKRLGILSRLNSILTDAAYALRMSELHKLPLVANERCGSWYVLPERRAASVYFKSTDGHTGQWSFSLRRLNLHILPVIEQYKGLDISQPPQISCSNILGDASLWTRLGAAR